MTWGQPHFRVGEKIFAGYGEEKGKATIGFKLERSHAEAILDDPRFTRAPYVGHAGWVSMDATRVKDWDEVRALVRESYGLIAPKRSIAKLGGGKPAAKPERAKAAPAKKAGKPKAAAKRATRRAR